MSGHFSKFPSGEVWPGFTIHAPSISLARWMFVAWILAAAFVLRVVSPNLYMTGFDMAGHVMASMRLHLTSPFEFENLLSSFFGQVIFFNHGYTTILLPWALYEVTFNLLRLPVTESRLNFIHSFIGILSLFSIFAFLKSQFGFRRAVVSLAVLAVLPIHVGLSRVHVGTQIISSIFFFACLTFLHEYLVTRRAKWRWLYYLAAFFYVGSDNTFFIGLGLQLVYLQLIGHYTGWKDRLDETIRLYLNPAALLAIGLPVAVYIGATIYAELTGLEGGYLDRLVTKVYKREIVIDILKVPGWIMEIIGPVVFICAAGIITNLHDSRWKRISPRALFLLIVFAVYFVLLNVGHNIERNYVFALVVPMLALASKLLVRLRILHIATILSTLLYTASIVFDVNILIPTTRNFGSVESEGISYLQAIKTLGYLERTGCTKVSKIKEGPVEKIGIFTSESAAFYYVGAWTSRWVHDDIENGALGKYPTYLVGTIPGGTNPENAYLVETVERFNLQPVGSIAYRGVPLLELYANQPVDQVYDFARLPASLISMDGRGLPVFEITSFNPLFDQEFGSLDTLPRVYLGHFGYKIR